MTAPENPSVHPLNPTNDASPGAFQPEPGMSLRDHFAGQALPTTIAYVMELVPPGHEPAPMFAATVARLSYQMADAMLVERAKGPAL